MAEEAKRPDSWEDTRARYPRWPRWLLWALGIEWGMEWAVYVLHRWAFVEFLQLAASFSIAVGAISYVRGGEQRRQAAEDARKARHYQAWQVINSAHGRGGSGARADALHDLHRDSVSLAGVVLTRAALTDLRLENAQLEDARLDSTSIRRAFFDRSIMDRVNFQAARITEATFEKSQLSNANFQDAQLLIVEFSMADLTGADLRRAHLSRVYLRGARLDWADMRGATVRNVSGLKMVAGMWGANVYGVRGDDAFVRFAIDSLLAVSVESDSVWERMKNDALGDRSR
jgi:uncharacterized protein YjbI with pentapeptide repeats